MQQCAAFLENGNLPLGSNFNLFSPGLISLSGELESFNTSSLTFKQKYVILQRKRNQGKLPYSWLTCGIITEISRSHFVKNKHLRQAPSTVQVSTWYYWPQIVNVDLALVKVPDSCRILMNLRVLVQFLECFAYEYKNTKLVIEGEGTGSEQLQYNEELI